MKQAILLLTTFVVLLFTGCSSGDQTEQQSLDTYPNAHLLLSATNLSDLLDDGKDILLVDARNETEDEVIPGAVHFPAVSSLVDDDHPVESFLVGPERFGQLMQEIGLNNDSRVVIYDDGNALSSARLFYALDYYGFSNASILNGGIQAWKENSMELETAPINPETGSFQVEVQEALVCDFEYITAASQSDDKIIFDTRSEEEYTGADERAAQSGHIPNAVHLEWNSVLEPEGIPYFLPAQEIQNIYTELGITPDKEVIPHCHTNVRGSHAYFTLRLMGYDSVRPYEGSWSEYGNREGATVTR